MQIQCRNDSLSIEIIRISDIKTWNIHTKKRCENTYSSTTARVNSRKISVFHMWKTTFPSPHRANYALTKSAYPRKNPPVQAHHQRSDVSEPVVIFVLQACFLFQFFTVFYARSVPIMSLQMRRISPCALRFQLHFLCLSTSNSLFIMDKIAVFYSKVDSCAASSVSINASSNVNIPLLWSIFLITYHRYFSSFSGNFWSYFLHSIAVNTAIFAAETDLFMNKGMMFHALSTKKSPHFVSRTILFYILIPLFWS